MKQLNYTKAVIIVHGKSEKQICQYIKNKLRLKIEIYSDKNGEKAIQITSLKNTLNNKIFKSFKNFIKTYENIKLTDDGKSLDSAFKIFIIMDTDDCSENQKKDFISKRMFESHWAYNNIVPIYNIPELETVLETANIPFKKQVTKGKKSILKSFQQIQNMKKQMKFKFKNFLTHYKSKKIPIYMSF